MAWGIGSMHKCWLLLFFLISTLACAEDKVAVPAGFVLQSLGPTDGQIAKPKDWHYTSKGTPSGWLWTLSKEDTSKGTYKTGMRIQLMLGLQGSGLTRQAFLDKFVKEKHASSKVVRECPVSDQGEFFRRCLEVIENIEYEGAIQPFHILYSLMWSKQMDMTVIGIFGTPPEDWSLMAATADAMAQFRLIGPDFGKDVDDGGLPRAANPPKPATFDTVYNHTTPASEQHGQDEVIKLLYARVHIR